MSSPADYGLAKTPHATAVHFQLRSAPTREALATATWSGPAGADSWYTKSGATIENLTGAWLQYRARLITPNGAATPYLTKVKIRFD